MTMNESIDLNVARVKALWMNGTTRVFVIPANAGIQHWRHPGCVRPANAASRLDRRIRGDDDTPWK
jgi:hypothetical protein